MKKSEFMEEQKKSKFDFEKDLSINKFKLDEECISHSSIYFRYAEAQQEAKVELSKAKNNLELIEAEANINIRAELIKNGVKFTEALITSYLAKDDSVKEAKEQAVKAEEVYSKLSVAVTAMEHRKSELDNLVKLYASGYFSVSNGSPESKKSITEQAERTVRKNLNSKE